MKLIAGTYKDYIKSVNETSVSDDRDVRFQRKFVDLPIFCSSIRSE